MRWIYRGALLGALALGLLPCGPAAAQAPGGPLLRGDVNADGSVTAVDALAVLSHVVGKTLPAGFTVSPNGDADGNGEVTALDALIMLSYVVGKDVSRYPLGKPLVDVSVTPTSVTVPLGGNTQLRARVAGGVADSAVIWRSDDASVAAVSASGIVTGIASGTTSVTALSRADTTRRASAAVTVTGTGPGTVSVSPDTATLAVGATRQLTATVRNAAGNPVPGATVTWASSDTLVARVSATGLATAVAPGVASVTATSGGRSGGATLTVRTASLVPAAYAVTTSTPDPVAGSTATLQAQLVDSAGIAIATAGKTVTWSSTGGGTFASPTSTTNAAGVATVTFTVATTAGTVHRVTAADTDGLTGTSGDLRVQVGGAGVVQVLAGDSQSVIVGLPVPVAPKVRVVDGSGNGVPEVPVTFAVAAGGGTLTGAVQTTNAAGEATLGSWTLGLVAGPNTLTASAPGATPATFTATGLVGSPTDIAKVSGDGGTSAAGTTRTLVARVTDAGGNGVPGETV
ncbi:MAG TPA: Ig-like domain-containing protein, partial [Longimicrobiaceae bacterium]